MLQSINNLKISSISDNNSKQNLNHKNELELFNSQSPQVEQINSSQSQEQKNIQHYLDTKKAADKGDIQAKVKLGVMYKDGIGTKQNLLTALGLFNEAANQGNVTAQFYLGWMYDTGCGVKQNHRLAEFWYKNCAINGNRSAQFNLAFIYENSKIGVWSDKKLAKHWYTQAANQGHQKAKLRLEKMKEREEWEEMERQRMQKYLDDMDTQYSSVSLDPGSY